MTPSFLRHGLPVAVLIGLAGGASAESSNVVDLARALAANVCGVNGFHTLTANEAVLYDSGDLNGQAGPTSDGHTYTFGKSGGSASCTDRATSGTSSKTFMAEVSRNGAYVQRGSWYGGEK